MAAITNFPLRHSFKISKLSRTLKAFSALYNGERYSGLRPLYRSRKRIKTYKTSMPAENTANQTFVNHSFANHTSATQFTK